MTPRPVVFGLIVVLLSVIFIMASVDTENVKETPESDYNEESSNDFRVVIDYDNPQRLPESSKNFLYIGSTQDFDCAKLGMTIHNATHCKKS